MVSMEIVGYPWISLDIRAMYALISIDIWISMGVDVLGCQWISMDIFTDFHEIYGYACPWTPGILSFARENESVMEIHGYS